jgi:hypothetical protein
MCIGEVRNAYTILTRKPEGRRLFRRPRHRWVASIKTVLQEIACEGVDWSHLVQDRVQLRGGLVTIIMNLGVP